MPESSRPACSKQRVGTLSAQQQALVEGIRSGLPHSDAATKAGYKTQPKLTDAVQRAIEGLRVHMCARTCTRQIGKTCQHTIYCWPVHAAKGTAKHEARQTAIPSTMPVAQPPGPLSVLLRFTSRPHLSLRTSPSSWTGLCTQHGKLP